MDRAYGRDQHCFVCGREPSIGFLYVCRQDCPPCSLASTHQTDDSDASKSTLRRELEHVGLSESVILTAERGEYTNAQLSKLKTQKLELKQIIADADQAKLINNVVAKMNKSASVPPNHDGASSSTPAQETVPPAPPGCHFKACHTCRPYYRDRIYISFKAVLSAEFIPMTPKDVAVLPTKPAETMRTIGLLPATPPRIDSHENSPSTLLASSTDPSTKTDVTASRDSMLTFKTTQSDMDELSAMRHPRRRFYNLGHRSSGDIARSLNRMPFFSRPGIRYAIQGIFHPSRDSSSSGSNITLPLARTGTVRELSTTSVMGEFDIGSLRRVRRQKERNDFKNGTYQGGFEGVAVPSWPQRTTSAESGGGAERSFDDDSASDFTVYSCVSEGSEVEVDGGVALTGEAVETHTPDILSDAALAHAKAMAQAEADEDNEQQGADSIMAQV
ncbi:hypothetical protein BDV95DRAFT_488918 [Massariosphaeria phaeospora]|uniref:Uncharacterized protein n=1 Tax=Massariosphaeria phaeospora TaxID=100035 RepID=A0A7C8MBA9_9PLEO|nr:hypothetical protein BDV95DRAFT_488918 [Massariosphaeria phaeospora]